MTYDQGRQTLCVLPENSHDKSVGWGGHSVNLNSN